ncbi:hypothetical protein M9Y10_006232 [Tritrichomonas musculus]|uniref:Uncharacterized protein n=1 Tax=Tritrichomonas musculus TaxID=1915356 RepID=A0ABR2JES3_9EUKA
MQILLKRCKNAFHYLHKYAFIEPYTSQIYAVYEALPSFGSKEEGFNNIMLQVYTGERKSFIIQALTEYLARQENIVHIATSNIILAARDFEKAYNYYVNCERKASKVAS